MRKSYKHCLVYILSEHYLASASVGSFPATHPLVDLSAWNHMIKLQVETLHIIRISL